MYFTAVNFEARCFHISYDSLFCHFHLQFSVWSRYCLRTRACDFSVSNYTGLFVQRQYCYWDSPLRMTGHRKHHYVTLYVIVEATEFYTIFPKERSPSCIRVITYILNTTLIYVLLSGRARQTCVSRSGKIVIFSILTENGLLKFVTRLGEGIRIIYMDS